MTYDFRRFTSVNDMTDAQRRAWHEAGRPPLGPEPKSKPASTVAMNREAQERWDWWAKTHVNNGLYALAYEIGAECGRIEARLLKRINTLERKLGELRAAAEVERVATNIIDLPRLPLRKKDNAA
jgi:hypothetical protein